MSHSTLDTVSCRLYDTLELTDLELAPVTLVRGPNEAGKSLLLSVPGRLLGGPSKGDTGRWRASGTWNRGTSLFTIARAYDGTHGSSTHGVRLNGSDTKVQTAAAQIAGSIGTAWSWSPLDFANLSARKRTAEIRRYLDLRWTVGWVQSRLLEADLAIDDLHALLPDDTLEPQWGNPGCTEGQDYLTAVVEGLQQAWRDQNEAIKKLRGAAATAASDLRDRDLPPTTTAAVQETIDSLDVQINAAERELGKHEGALEGVRALREAVSTAERMARQAKNHATEASRLSEVALLAAGKAIRDYDANVEKRAEALEKRTKALEAVDKCTANVLEAEQRAAAARRNAAVKTACDAFPPLVELLDTIELLGAEQDILDLAAEVQRARDLGAELDVIEQEVTIARTQLAAANRLVRDNPEPPPVVDERDAKNEARLRAVRHHEQALEQESQHARDLENVREKLAQAEQDTAAQMAAQLTEQLETLRANRTAKARELRALQDSEAMRQQAMNLGAREAAEIETRDQVYAAGKAVRALETTLLDEATGKLLDVAGQLTDRVVGARLGLELVDGETHVVVGNRRLDACSRSVQALGLTAMQVAVAATLEGWKCPIIDDAEMFELPRAERLLEGLAHFVADEVIDQAIVACVGRELEALSATGPSGIDPKHVRNIDLERPHAS